MANHDQETRQRLLEAATRLFAEHGFHHVTVRQICKAADANVASINYHFGDKMGLYQEILRSAVEAMRQTTEAARSASEGAPPEERLRLTLRLMMRRFLARGRDSSVQRLMIRESADPTEALDAVVADGLAPRFLHFSELVAELVGCPLEDPRVSRGAANIQALCFAHLPNPMTVRLHEHLPFTWQPSRSEAEVDELADELATFALAGLRELARSR